MFFTRLKSVALFAALLSTLFVNMSADAGASLRLQARLTGNTSASGKATYEQRDNGRRKFSVEVEKSLRSTVHTIVVSRGGVGFATVDISTNALGRFDLNLDTVRGQAVPVLRAGDVVTVWAAGRVIVGGKL